MCQRYVADTGRQIASSDCSQRLVALIFSDDNVKAKNLIVQLCQGSSDIRDRLSESNLITRLVDEARTSTNDTQLHSTLLSTFAQDAWGRATLRKIGALDLLVERFSKSEDDIERLSIVQSLKHFIHDTAGMAHLARSCLFLETIIRDVQLFVNEHKLLCEHKQKSEDDYYRPNSPLLMEIESSMRRQSAENSEPSVLHKTFYYAPPDSFSPLSSPPYSTPSTERASPVNSTSTSPELSYLATTMVDTISSLGDKQVKEIDVVKQKKHIIDTELWLITWQAQEDTNIAYLIREDLVIEIIRYLSLIAKADFRASRALKRMASSRSSIDTLLEMQFHIRVYKALCDVPCRTLRFSARCSRCEKCIESGKEILKEFSCHVDSGYGDSFLARRIKSENFLEKLQASIAKVLLLKDTAGSRRKNASNIYSIAFNTLFSCLEEILRKSEGSCAIDHTTYADGPTIISQIVFAVSGLISNRKAREILEIDEPYSHPEVVSCQISQYNTITDNETVPDDRVELLVFTNESNEVIVKIPLESACKNSDYFQGMFSSNLAEKTSNRRTFQFNSAAENCADDDFVRFIHFLAGCRDKCSQIDSASCCKALINLADRYICTALSEWICTPHGPAMKFLTGEILPVVLFLSLLTEMYPRLLNKCFLTLVRYCSAEDLQETCDMISSSPVITTLFIKGFREFLGE
ncbi:unnamed protein product [Auanema sp. JU1783]|nr:unnamed protein product [Auanema sp. JU1783]